MKRMLGKLRRWFVGLFVSEPMVGGVRPPITPNRKQRRLAASLQRRSKKS